MTPLTAETRERIERIRNIMQEAYELLGFKDISDREYGVVCALAQAIEDLTQLAEEERREREKARPLSEWSEDDGFVLWWAFPVVEPPYVGTPLCDDFPTGVTHFTPFVTPPKPPNMTSQNGEQRL